jgi:hypothetical protein
MKLIFINMRRINTRKAGKESRQGKPESRTGKWMGRDEEDTIEARGNGCIKTA